NDLLTKAGFDVVSTDNGEDAIVKARQVKPDLILMDVVMPGLNGFQATRAIRLDLRSFQQELATRLAAKTTAQVESSRLGIECHGERWLVRLSDAGEVIAVPPIVP